MAFMILGNLCTRACRFCNVKSGKPNGVLDSDEPRRIARVTRDLESKYVVLTSVDRDDLPDSGASHFAGTITQLRSVAPGTYIEALTPDFGGNLSRVDMIVRAGPDVFGHNLETTERLTPQIRDPRASYHQSLKILERVKKVDEQVFTKSSLMLGLGEEEEDVLRTLHDLRAIGTDFLTLGQYLRPSPRNLPVAEYITPEQFNRYRKVAEQMGFLFVASGPLVRSSYRAGEYFLGKTIKLTPRRMS